MLGVILVCNIFLYCEMEKYLLLKGLGKSLSNIYHLEIFKNKNENTAQSLDYAKSNSNTDQC